MHERASLDKSHGYEALAETFMRTRNQGVGTEVVREWCRTLEPASAVLDLGCGSGVPISAVLVEAGFAVYGVDASPSMIRAFERRFAHAEFECAAVEDATFAGRTFDGAIAWGLVFLLTEAEQAALFIKVAGVLKPGGRFLFTAPRLAARWKDAMTGEESISLGAESYERLLQNQGLEFIGNAIDEGDNFYLSFVKR